MTLVLVPTNGLSILPIQAVPLEGGLNRLDPI